MTVGELKQRLLFVPDNVEIVVEAEHDGNGYCWLDEIIDNGWLFNATSCEIFFGNDMPLGLFFDDLTEEEFEVFKKDSERVVLFSLSSLIE